MPESTIVELSPTETIVPPTATIVLPTETIKPTKEIINNQENTNIEVIKKIYIQIGVKNFNCNPGGKFFHRCFKRTFSKRSYIY